MGWWCLVYLGYYVGFHVFINTLFLAILQKREIGSYIPVHVSDSEDDSDSDGEADLTQNPETEAIKINLFDKNAFEPTPKPEVKVWEANVFSEGEF